MYDTMRRKYYWPIMYGDVEHYVWNCRSCAQVDGTLTKSQTKLQLFPATAPFEELAIDLVGPLPKTRNGKKHILVITDRYSKLSRATAMAQVTAPYIASVMLNTWIFPYGIPDSILTDNGPQFIADFFEHLCAILGVKRVPITAYHAQTNGQTERYNQTLERRLRHYVNDHQDDWDTFVPSYNH